MTRKNPPPHKRVENPEPIRSTPRDILILQALLRYRVLSTPQIEALFFPSSTYRGCATSCQTRLRKLFDHQYVDRIFLPMKYGDGRAPFIHTLDRRGLDLLAAETGVEGKRKKLKQKTWGPDFLSHRLAVNEVQVVVELLTQNTRLELMAWIDEDAFSAPAMRNRVPRRRKGNQVVRNYPDGYFRLGVPGMSQDAHFFLEVDRGTMSYARWQEKVQAYTEFRVRGQSEKHFGTQNFRLLTVATSEGRLQGLREATEAAEGSSRFWFTTQDEVDIWQPERFLSAIWHIATKERKGSLLPAGSF